MTKKEFYNSELEQTSWYDEVWKIELIRVRDEDNLLVRNHYWQDEAGELWVDFGHPMENVVRGFSAYRLKKGYLTPDEIRHLREQLGMTVRSFADVLGIAPSSLTQIENNQRVQAKYQENLFRTAKTWYEKEGHLPRDWSSHELPTLTDMVTDALMPYETGSYYEERVQARDQCFSENSELGDAV